MSDKDCKREDCLVMRGPGMTTLLGWTPLYDKAGTLVNKDPNTTTLQCKCVTCGEQWTETHQGDTP